RNEPTLLSNAKSGQAKTGGRNACHHTMIVSADVVAVLHQSGLRVSPLPEVAKAGSFQFLKKLLIIWAEGRLRGRSRWRLRIRFLHRGPGRQNPPMRKRRGDTHAENLPQQLPARIRLVLIGPVSHL